MLNLLYTFSNNSQTLRLSHNSDYTDLQYPSRQLLKTRYKSLFFHPVYKYRNSDALYRMIHPHTPSAAKTPLLLFSYYAFSDSNDLSSVATTATDASDVIYVPTDNTVASNTEIINNICLPAKVPVITGEEGICSGCGVATLSISYYDLGVTTGKMAVKILKDGEDISTMPIEYAPNFTKEYNKDICEELGIEVPDDYVAIGEAAEETAK